MKNQIVKIITVQQHPPPKNHSIPPLKNLKPFRPTWVPREVTLPGLWVAYGSIGLCQVMYSPFPQRWRWSRALSLRLHIPTSSQSPVDNDWGEKPCRKQLSRAIYLDLVCSEVIFLIVLTCFAVQLGWSFRSFDYYLKKQEIKIFLKKEKKI